VEPLEEYRAKFRVDELLVYRNSTWTWSVRPVQTTLGSGILSLNRYATAFADITEDEALGLRDAVSHLSARLADVFQPEKMNYMMLMMFDSHLHFHVLPRYSETKTFAGLEWADSGWPGAAALADYADRADSHAILEIRDALT
jgi:diadenosine tetraphosphate (Ap4A) HIT family hydrolase